MNFTLVTPTCDRPEAFALCQKWMARQTIPYHQWIVLDDGLNPAKCTMGQIHLCYTKTRGKGSLANKLKLLLSDSSTITGDAIALIEDDDWYAPNYLELAASRFEDYDMIGEGHALYYNVRRRWWHLHTNDRHASLCQTLIRRSGLEAFAACLNDPDPFIDVRLWKTKLRSKLYLPEIDRHSLVGIKGLYPGYGIGHERPLPHLDPQLSKLKKVIGSESGVYAGYYS